jgi:hypothetical protein
LFSGPLDSLFLFNLSTQEWGGRFGIIKGDSPPGRYKHGFVAAAGKFYVFAGVNGSHDASSKLFITSLRENLE